MIIRQPVADMIDDLLFHYTQAELDEIVLGISDGRGGTRVREPRRPSPDPSGMMASVFPSDPSLTLDH